MTSLRAFGFGSYFQGNGGGRDIDLLLLHENLSQESIGFAIEAKRLVIAQQPSCDVVMLAEEEERAQGFILRSDAIPLGHLNAETLDSDVSNLVRMIGKF